MLKATSFAVTAAAAMLVAVPALAQDKTAEIDKVFSSIAPEAPGCAVGVSQNGKVLATRAYGMSDVEHKVPLHPTSLFDIARLTPATSTQSVPSGAPARVQRPDTPPTTLLYHACIAGTSWGYRCT